MHEMLLPGKGALGVMGVMDDAVVPLRQGVGQSGFPNWMRYPAG